MLITTLIAYESISQSSNDTACIPIAQLKVAINKIETAKVVQNELQLTKNALNIAEKRLVVKDSIINVHELKEVAYKAIIADYKKTEQNSEQVIFNLEKAITLEQRKTRRQKFGKVLGVIAGVAFGVLISK